MSKNIIILSDGTGQKGGVGSNTNVYKLFNMLEARTDNQLVFYDPGLGTDWRKITGAIAGRGFSKNLIDCYIFLFKNYKAGDEVFLFGFSRGAATVRSLSGFIHMFGILPQSRADLIAQAFKIYKIKNPEIRKKKADAFIGKHHTMWCKIKFIGVWDTVAALGLPNKFISRILDVFLPNTFHNFKLSESVTNARHALSIDEERKTFLPVLWDKLEDGNDAQTLKQVWFAGVHTDVGGGYAADDLSNISLNWMIRESKEFGLRIYENAPAFKALKVAPFNPNGIMHNEQLGIKGLIFKSAIRSWDALKNGTLRIHESVYKRTKNTKNEETPAYNPWILMQAKSKSAITES